MRGNFKLSGLIYSLYLRKLEVCWGPRLLKKGGLSGLLRGSWDLVTRVP